MKTYSGELVFYDLVDINPTSFDIKNEVITTVTPKESFDDTQNDLDSPTISQKPPVVKTQSDTTFSERGNGYDGYSMSNNARAAYENGEMPISK